MLRTCCFELHTPLQTYHGIHSIWQRECLTLSGMNESAYPSPVSAVVDTAEMPTYLQAHLK
jgi:hypothetical protein